MNSTPFQNYLHSFSLKKAFWFTFAIDLIFIVLVVLAFMAFNNYAKAKTTSIAGTADPEQFQQQLATMTPEQLLSFGEGIKSFLTVFAVGLLVLIVFTWLGYSLAAAWNWNYLTGRKFQLRTAYWRWNALQLIILLLTVGYVAIALLIKLLFSLLFSLAIENANLLQFLNQLVSLLLLLLFFIFLFLIYHSFVQKYRVWESLAGGFKLFFSQARAIGIAYLFMMGTALALSLIYWLIYLLLSRQYLFPEKTTLWIQLVLSLLFLAWLRLYVLQTVPAVSKERAA